jgi:tetratricopeptide (TPR) repeat protein
VRRTGSENEGRESALDPRQAGFEHLARGEPEKASAAFREALVVDPLDLDAREGLARALLARGDHEGALAELSAVLAKDPARGSAERIRSEALMRAGRYEDAVFHLKRAMKLESGGDDG